MLNSSTLLPSTSSTLTRAHHRPGDVPAAPAALKAGKALAASGPLAQASPRASKLTAAPGSLTASVRPGLAGVEEDPAGASPYVAPSRWEEGSDRVQGSIAWSNKVHVPEVQHSRGRCQYA